MFSTNISMFLVSTIRKGKFDKQMFLLKPSLVLLELRVLSVLFSLSLKLSQCLSSFIFQRGLGHEITSSVVSWVVILQHIICKLSRFSFCIFLDARFMQSTFSFTNSSNLLSIYYLTSL